MAKPHSPCSHNTLANQDCKLSHGTGKRNRIHFACTVCYCLKQKCNCQTPGQHRITCKVPDRCCTFQPDDNANDVNSRLLRLKKMLKEYLPALDERFECLLCSLQQQHHQQQQHQQKQQQPQDHAKLSTSTLTASPPDFRPGYHQQQEHQPPHINTASLAAAANSDKDPTVKHNSLSPKMGVFIGGGTIEMHLGTLQ